MNELSVRANPASEIARRKLDFLWLEVTQKCNLTCQHCYVSSGPDLPLFGRMRPSDWVNTIVEAGKLGCKSLQFIGGEPLLYPKIDELIQAAKDNGFELIEVFTNGTPITRHLAENFSRWNVQVACSMYSADSRIHDTITQKSGSFDRTISALKILAELNVPVRVGFIEMETNRGEFEGAKALLAGMGINRIGHDFIREFGRGQAPVEARPELKGKFDGLCGQCWRGRMCVTYSGDAFPCIMGRSFNLGNVLDDGFAAVAQGRALMAFRDEMAAELAIAHGPNTGLCSPGPSPCMVCGPGVCSPDVNPCVPEIPICGPAGPT